MSSHLVIAVLLLSCSLPACRSAAEAQALVAPVRIDAGSGSPDAMARRAATELADAEILAALAPRVGVLDRRYLVRLDRHEPTGSGTHRAFQGLFERALLGTGRFLLVEDAAAPVVRAQVSGSLGSELVCVRVRSATGDEWLDIHGSLEPRH